MRGSRGRNYGGAGGCGIFTHGDGNIPRGICGRGDAHCVSCPAPRNAECRVPRACCQTRVQRDIGCIKTGDAFGEGEEHVETAGLCAGRFREGYRRCVGDNSPKHIGEHTADNIARVMDGFRAAEPRCHQRIRVACRIGGFVQMSVAGTLVPRVRCVKFRADSPIIRDTVPSDPIEISTD